MKNAITEIAKELMGVVKDKIVLLENSSRTDIDGFKHCIKHEVTFLIYNEVAFRILTAAFGFNAIKVSKEEYPMIFIMNQLEHDGILSNIDARVDAATVGAKLFAAKLEERKEAERLKLFLVKSASDETEVIFAKNEDEAKKLNPMNLEDDSILIYDIPAEPARIVHY